MAKLTEEEKAERRRIKQEAQEEQERLAREEEARWIANYPSRVKEYRSLIKSAELREIVTVTYRSLIKSAELREIVTVTDDLTVLVSANLRDEYDTDNVVLFSGEKYYFDQCDLTPDTPDWEYEGMVRALRKIVEAKEAREKYMASVREFKKSLTDEQLRMIEDFKWV